MATEPDKRRTTVKGNRASNAMRKPRGTVPPRQRAPVEAMAAPIGAAADWRAAVAATVDGLGYDLVDVERGARGLLRVTIDRRPGHAYASAGEAITVDDCETVTRQLQYALEVDGVDYARLEVSSPGLDRPLRTEADCARFSGQAVELALKEPFQGRRHFQGVLGPAAEGGSTGEQGEGAATGGQPARWQLAFKEGRVEQALSFTLAEVREMRLVPVVDFKGRARSAPGSAAAPAAAATNEVVGGMAR